jgi:L-rhamnose mutarotase
MSKPIVAILLALLALAFIHEAHAATQYVPYPEQPGIITPDKATGMRSYSIFNNDANGEMVVCLDADDFSWRTMKCGSNNNGWKKLVDQVPHGRYYVGFRVVNSRIEVYWK